MLQCAVYVFVGRDKVLYTRVCIMENYPYNDKVLFVLPKQAAKEMRKRKKTLFMIK